MLTLVLLASLGQVYADDFYCMQAQENFVIDNLPKPVGYMTYIPAELAEQVDRWADECWRCRRTANQNVLALGPSYIRWLFWTMRSTDLRTALHSEAMIMALARCSHCGGGGYCQRFVPMKDYPETCETCWFYREYRHDGETRCVHCDGGGMFEIEVRYHQSGYLIDRQKEAGG
jgi:hypothetical protein